MNNTIFFFFYNLAHKSEFFDKLVIFTANIFPYIVILLAIIFLLMHHEKNPPDRMTSVIRMRWKEIFFIFLSSGFAWFFAYFLKILIHASRPFIVFSQVRPLFPETDFSFPSGHASFFAALATSIFLSHKKAGYVFLFFALLIGLARIVAGVHFPLDILGGFILGPVIAYFLKNI